MLSYNLCDDEPPEYEGISLSLFELYRQRTAQCLLLTDVTKCVPNTLETLLLNGIADFSRRGDDQKAAWIMVGVAVRVAFQMGYHR